MDEQGSIRDPCRSRVLESALMLRLIRRAGIDLAEEEDLVRFLTRHRCEGNEFDRFIVGCALGGPTNAGAARSEMLTAIPTALRSRKEIFLAGVLTVFDVVPPGNCDGEVGTRHPLHTWAAVEMTALKVILARRADSSTTELLLSVQRGDEVWDGNLLVHLLVQHALAYLPLDHDVITDGIIKALRYQRRDGGMPFVANTDTWCTVTAGLALVTAGAPRHDIYRIGDFLQGQQRPNGLWSYSELTRQTDLDDSTVCLEFLDALDTRRYRPNIVTGLRSVADAQGPDGGFPTYEKGAPSEAYITAAAINALSIDTVRYRGRICRALDYLAANQLQDGTFESNWSRSRFHALFRVLLAVSRVPSASLSANVADMASRAAGAVVNARNRDGGWGQQAGDPSDATSTAYALMALAGYDHPQLIADGVHYLHHRIGSSGAIESIPDMLGPRPFVINVPILADIYALLALGHLRPHLAISRRPIGERLEWRPQSVETVR